MLTRSNSKAYAVLAILYSKLSEDELRGLIVEPYFSDSENGFTIELNFHDTPYKKIAFCESLVSNHIFVFESIPSGFDKNGNSLSRKETYKTKSFSKNGYLSAANYIVKSLHDKKIS